MVSLLCFAVALTYALYGLALGAYWSLCDSIDAALYDALCEVR